jgi:hypothetical protein
MATSVSVAPRSTCGQREGRTTDEKEELTRLRRENFELRRATRSSERPACFTQELDRDRPS